MARWIVGGPAEEDGPTTNLLGRAPQEVPAARHGKTPPSGACMCKGDDIKWFREIETLQGQGQDGYSTSRCGWLETPRPAASKDGDIVKMFNERGTILCGARISERVTARSVVIAKGSRVDPIAPT